MWHETVTEDGKTIADQDMKVGAILIVDGEGVAARSTIEGNGFDALRLLVGLDSLREGILNDDEIVRMAYLLRGDLYNVMEIETGAIKSAVDKLREKK